MHVRSFPPLFVREFVREFVEDGGAGEAPDAPEPAGQPADPPAPAQDAGATGSGWSGPSEDDWYQSQSMLRSLAERFQAPADEPAQFTQPSDAGGWDWDPLADDAGQQLVGLLGQRDEYLLGRFQEMLGPVVSHTREQLTQEAESRAMDVLVDIEAREGEFGGDNGRQIARVLADSYFPQAAERYGNSPRAAEHALSEAASALRSYEKAVSERAVNQFKASLKGVAGAPFELGVESTGSIDVQGAADTESEAVNRIFGTLVNV